jgi:micrococcal nuclease
MISPAYGTTFHPNPASSRTPRLRMSGRRRCAIALLVAFVALPLVSVSSCTNPRKVEGKVTRVSDGDTLILVTGEGTKLKVRLYGIDAPEIRHERVPGQPYGREAKDALTEMALGRKVTLEIVDIDMHRRMVGIVRISGADINQEMIRNGLAWAYRRYLSAPYASVYIAAEKEARSRRLGLWKQANPDPPWNFKRKRRPRASGPYTSSRTTTPPRRGNGPPRSRR